MGKRAAAKASTSPSKAKAARKEEPVAASPKAVPAADEPSEQCKPVLELIEQASSISDSCREMLLAMSPFCLQGSPDVRHDYQHRMAEVLKKVVSGVEAERSAGVEECEATVQEVAKQQEEAAGTVAAAREAADAARSDRDEKEKAMKEAEQAATSAEEVLKEAKERVGTLDTERAQAAAEKGEYEELVADTWATLKAGSLPGQKWRARDKLIASVLEMLEKIGLDVSLQGALPVALKTKPSERGKFAEKAVSFGEELLSKHVAALGEKLEAFEGEAASRAQAVTDAETALKEAVQLKEQRQDDLVTSEKTLLEKDKALAGTQKAEKAMIPKAQKADLALQTAKGGLAEVQTLIVKFTELLEGPKEVLPELKAEETEEAAPAAVEEAAA